VHATPSAEPIISLSVLGRVLGARSARTVPVTRQSTGRLVEVTTFLRDEQRWAGELPAGHRAIPNKVALDFEGTPLYPEFVVVRLLERGGWGAAWRKSWGGSALWSDIGRAIEPPAWVTGIVDQVSAHTGWAGAWEIVAWRSRRVLFLQSRPVGNDRVGAYHARWLDVALTMGLPLEAFAIVEYQAA